VGEHTAKAGLSRREFLRNAAAGALVLAAGASCGARTEPAGRRESMAQTVLPRWRGFNLLEMFTTRSDGNWREDDFRWMKDWGFDFVRLPLCYTLWIEDDDPMKISEAGLAKVDRAVELGRTYGIHMNVSFHRGPGYSVNRERKEPYNLWKDQAALDAFCYHWTTFATRYKGVASSQVSFNLINEPASPVAEMTREDHKRVVKAASEAIHKVDPDRLVIADGVDWASTACPELADLKVVQSCRAYTPGSLTHFRAEWAGGNERQPVPSWPGQGWDRRKLEEFYQPWADLASKGIGVHCGEGGSYNKTPHPVVMGWLRDVMEVLKGHNIGYAMWNFRGSFGILDSGRTDVEYEEFRGHKLDRRMLELLQEF
jgi:endoglucanase